jgi:hypothetical protein
MPLGRVRNRLILSYFDEGNDCSQDDEKSDGKGDDNGQKRRIAFAFFRGRVVVGLLWIAHEALDAGATS